jgi:hypothetical protein
MLSCFIGFYSFLVSPPHQIWGNARETIGKLFAPISTKIHRIPLPPILPGTFTSTGITPISALFPHFAMWSWREMNRELGTVGFMGDCGGSFVIC